MNSSRSKSPNYHPAQYDDNGWYTPAGRQTKTGISSYSNSSRSYKKILQSSRNLTFNHLRPYNQGSGRISVLRMILSFPSELLSRTINFLFS